MGAVEVKQSDPSSNFPAIPSLTENAGPGNRPIRDCGDIDMRIARDGTWSYRGSPIHRLALVQLFASVLRREADCRYWLVTPAERGRIEVDDVPFLAVGLAVDGAGREQQLIFRTNLDDNVTAGPDNPLRVEIAASGQPAPYILVRDGLEARLSRPVFYDLVELGVEEQVEGVASSGYGAEAGSSGLASPGRIGNDRTTAGFRRDGSTVREDNLLTREWAIARFRRQGQPGRRGFGGTADAAETAALRHATRGDHDLNPGWTLPSAELRPAAVLVPLIERAEGMSVLLTQRTAHLSAHAGQISFPGGRIEPGDRDATEAALRETEEEVGLPREHVTVIGRLDTYVTGTGFEIIPAVGIVRAPFPLAVDPFEVAEAFEVPLAFIMDPNNHRRVVRVFEERSRTFFVLPFENRYIWGATAGMLVNLAEVLAG
jgi:8-oxo-dGTP pyrophosphatase MutT (NUDIX family)